MSALMRAMGLVLLFLLAAGCATHRPAATPAPHYKVGKPYKVNGRWYHPKADPDYDEVGIASWYGDGFHGRRTANGEIFDKNALTGAHTTLPLPSLVEVRNLENGRKVILRINDRGPFARNRIIDLSHAAARRLGFDRQGLARVRVRYAGPAPLSGAGAPRRAKPAAPAPALQVFEPPDRDIAEMITALQEAPALTPGAEQAALAEKAPPIPSTKRPPGANKRPSADAAREAPGAAAAPKKASPGALETNPPETAARTLYLIRVAALTRLDNIDALRGALSNIGPLRVARIETPDGAGFYRINMGPYANRSEAAQRLEAVRKAGYGDAALVTITP